jgi:hypothetical protein
MKCTAIAIEGTVNASYFPNGVPTKGWYQSWLRMLESLPGPLRPLEDTREAWYTEETLKKYFDVARDVLAKVSVARLNPESNPSQTYS